MTVRLPPFFSEPVEIGRGRFGVVYRVRQQGVGRWIALKSLPASAREEAEAEARHLATLELPVLPAVYGVHAHRGRIFVAEEWLQGPSLASVLEHGLGEELGLDRAGAVSQALACLHDAGLAHGDFKPANILCTVDGRIRLVDLGFARRSAVGGAVAGGTPAYLAPELQSGEACDPVQADLWSLGVVLHELLTGTRPSPQDLSKGFPRLDRCGLPHGGVGLVKALLASDPALRPPAREVALGLAVSGEASGAVQQLCARLFAREMADRLHEAGKSALVRDPERAFAMLSEALEHDPDHVPSLELLPHIHMGPAKSRKLAWMAAAGLAIAALVAAVLVLSGRGSGGAGRPDPLVVLAQQQERDGMRVAMAPQVGGGGGNALPLREIPAREEGQGVVRFEGFPVGSRLRLGEVLDSLSDSMPELRRLRAGRIRIQVEKAGKILHLGYHEILDFQTLVIRPDGVGKDAL